MQSNKKVALNECITKLNVKLQVPRGKKYADLTILIRNLYCKKVLFFFKSVYTPKKVSKKGLLTGLKIASINQTLEGHF